MSPVQDPRFGGGSRLSVLDASRAAAEAEHARQRKITTVMLIVSLALFPVLAFSFATPELGAMAILLLLVISLVLRVVFGVIGAFILSATVVGGMGYLGEAVFKLTAIYAVTTVTGGLMSDFGFLANIINLIVFIGLVQWLFDLEGGEAWIFAVITGILGGAGAIIAGLIYASL
ncbi:MAG: hypothetical protein KC983_12805 [Phycisphaerales bacterium]|nr:hypothetical protein [Phycisphaerales bacterium]